MDNEQLKMRTLDFMGFRKSNFLIDNWKMYLDTKNAAIIVDFGIAVLGNEAFMVNIQQQGCTIAMPSVRTVGDMKRLYHVLTGEEMKAFTS